jgi:hypothetical protein
MKRMTFFNDFHNTQCTILVPEDCRTRREVLDWIGRNCYRDQYDTVGISIRRKENRLRRELCTVTGCGCGVYRGPQGDGEYL